jgi:hypothetical protein
VGSDRIRHRVGRGYPPRCRMSLEAIAWALVQAPDVPPECVSLLIGLANHADSRGRGAYAGQKLLAEYARKSDRSVRNDLGKLQQRGLIRLGDQALAGHIAADCRPVVYDLALERKQASARKHTSARQQASAATSDRLTEPQPPDQQEHGGGGSTLPPGSEVPGGSEEQRERKPASDKPKDNQEKNSPSESSKGGLGGDALFAADKESKSRTRRQSLPVTHPRFDEWYGAYPLHKARGDAEKAYAEAVAKGADPDDLLAGAVRYQDDPQVKRGFIKYPGGWLRSKCWLDEPAPHPSANGSGPGRQVNYPDEEYTSDWGPAR